MLRKYSYKEIISIGESLLNKREINNWKLDVRLILSAILQKSLISIICDRKNYLSSKKKEIFKKPLSKKNR